MHTHQVVYDLTSLVVHQLHHHVTDFKDLSAEELESIREWAAAVHMRASDNDGVKVPPVPIPLLERIPYGIFPNTITALIQPRTCPACGAESVFLLAKPRKTVVTVWPISCTACSFGGGSLLAEERSRLIAGRLADLARWVGEVLERDGEAPIDDDTRGVDVAKLAAILDRDPSDGWETLLEDVDAQRRKIVDLEDDLRRRDTRAAELRGQLEAMSTRLEAVELTAQVCSPNFQAEKLAKLSEWARTGRIDEGRIDDIPF